MGYDIKFGKNSYLLMAGAMLLFGLFNLIFKFDFMRHMGMQVIMSIGIVVIGVACVMLIFQNFNKTIFGPEGYLTLTLPVKRRSVLLSKLVTTIVWFNVMLAAFFVTMLMISGEEMGLFFVSSFDLFFVLNVLTVWIALNIVIINAVLYLYMGLTLSNISVAGRKFGWIFGAVSAVAATALEILAGKYVFERLFGGNVLWIIRDGALGSSNVSVFFGKSGYIGYGEIAFSQMDMNPAPFACMAAFSVIAWFVTLYLLKKKVDLQ
jgi:hypothetical protein